jgi:hypothetical protein
MNEDKLHNAQKVGTFKDGGYDVYKYDNNVFFLVNKTTGGIHYDKNEIQFFDARGILEINTLGTLTQLSPNSPISEENPGDVRVDPSGYGNNIPSTHIGLGGKNKHFVRTIRKRQRKSRPTTRRQKRSSHTTSRRRYRKK